MATPFATGGTSGRVEQPIPIAAARTHPDLHVSIPQRLPSRDNVYVPTVQRCGEELDGGGHLEDIPVQLKC